MGRRSFAASMLVLIGAWLAALPASASTTGSGTERVLVADVKAVVTPVLADHIQDGIAQAEREGHAAFVIQLDTPGGLDASMRDIVQSMLAADVAIVVHVAPQGARAASAGAIITMAAHIAAMAPATAIGAATPVDLGGGEITAKIINDFAAYAEALARTRGRNVEFAIDAVREGRSVPNNEAVRLGVVDLIAPDLATLLQRIDGRTVQLPDREVTLATADATVVQYELRGFRRLLQFLADPNIAFLFMSLGTLGIIYELANPGMGGGGIVGVILLLLALFGLSVLPVNAVGVMLMVLAGILFVAEVLTPGIGIFAAGGTASLVLGGIFLFRGDLGVDPLVLVPVAATAGGLAVFVGRFAWRTRRIQGRSGTSVLVGSRAIVQSAEGTTGKAIVQGAWWTLIADHDLEPGATVRVVGVEDLKLLVEPEPNRKESL